jgi:hypothetical protein
MVVFMTFKQRFSIWVKSPLTRQEHIASFLLLLIVTLIELSTLFGIKSFSLAQDKYDLNRLATIMAREVMGLGSSTWLPWDLALLAIPVWVIHRTYRGRLHPLFTLFLGFCFSILFRATAGLAICAQRLAENTRYSGMFDTGSSMVFICYFGVGLIGLAAYLTPFFSSNHRFDSTDASASVFDLSVLINRLFYLTLIATAGMVALSFNTNQQGFMVIVLLLLFVVMTLNLMWTYKKVKGAGKLHWLFRAGGLTLALILIDAASLIMSKSDYLSYLGIKPLMLMMNITIVIYLYSSLMRQKKSIEW